MNYLSSFRRAAAALLLLAATSLAAQAQSTGVGIGTTTPAASAALDVTATGKGLLIPRMDSATRVAIASPATGLLVFQTAPRIGFYYYGGSAWLFLPDKARSGDNLGSHNASTTLTLNNNQLQLRSGTDFSYVLRYNGTYDGPLLYGFNGGALGYTLNNGGTITPVLRWLGGTGANAGNAGIGTGTAVPTSKLQVNGPVAVGVNAGLTGAASPGTALGNAAGYYGLAPASGLDKYQLPAASACPGRIYYIRNNDGSISATLTSASGQFYDGAGGGGVNTYDLNASGSSKTVTVISDGTNWTVIRTAN